MEDGEVYLIGDDPAACKVEYPPAGSDAEFFHVVAYQLYERGVSGYRARVFFCAVLEGSKRYRPRSRLIRCEAGSW